MNRRAAILVMCVLVGLVSQVSLAELADLRAASQPSDLPQATIPAFPGAEGGGMYSFGGRGGKVYVVTTLEDYDPATEEPIPGSFRQAAEAEGKRIIVFAVSGWITLKAPVEINHPYVTIAGQTAPGDGVGIRGETVHMNTHDVVIRYMRFRRGELERRDDALGGNPVGNIMIDHVSASWGLDENISVYRHMYDPNDGSKRQKLPTVNVTIQWIISSEALNLYDHAFGATWGGHNTMFHHNLFACNTGRNPSIGMYNDFNFVNNVLFNWRHRTMDGGDHRSWGNIINNYYKPGPVTMDSVRHLIIKPEGRRVPRGQKAAPDEFGKWYVHGNVVEGNLAVSEHNWVGGVQFGGNPTEAEFRKIVDASRVDEPLEMAPVTIHSAEEAYRRVLEDAGASLPVRDAVDRRIIESVRTGKFLFDEGIIERPDQVGGWPELASAPAPPDADSDGMPDAWETEHGLNPQDAADAAEDKDGDGYTNVEEYLNGTDPAAPVDYTDLSNNVNTLRLTR